MPTFVHVVQNPVKVISLEGTFKDKKTWRKPFAKQNGDIFNGNWLLALKSFSYKIVHKQGVPMVPVPNVLDLHCNVVTGFEQKLSKAPSHFYPPIATLFINSSSNETLHHKDFESPTFFQINNASDMLEIEFSHFKTDLLQFSGQEENLIFKAVFHYVCQSSS